MAQYRVGHFAAALDTLARADRANSLLSQDTPPDNLAFLAMAQFQLGRLEEARFTLSRLQQAIKQPRLAGDRDAQAFLLEAKALLQAQPAN